MAALYGLPETRKTGYLCAAAGVPAVQPTPPVQQEPIRDGFLRTQQSPRCRSRHLSCPAVAEHRRRRDLHVAQAGKAGLRDRGQGSRTATASRANRPPAEEPLAGAVCQRRCRPRREFREEMRRLPHLRQGRAEPRRPQSLGRRRPSEGVGGGLQLFRGDEGPEGQLDAGRPRRLPDQSARPWCPAPT